MNIINFDEENFVWKSGSSMGGIKEFYSLEYCLIDDIITHLRYFYSGFYTWFDTREKRKSKTQEIFYHYYINISYGCDKPFPEEKKVGFIRVANLMKAYISIFCKDLKFTFDETFKDKDTLEVAMYFYKLQEAFELAMYVNLKSSLSDYEKKQMGNRLIKEHKERWKNKECKNE